MDTVPWEYSFNNLNNRLKNLENIILLTNTEKNDYIQDATIYRYKFVIEMFWKTLKKVLSYEKIESTTPRDTIAKTFQFELIDDEEIWLKMLDDRNRTSHIYSQTEAHEIFQNIKTYLPVFQKSYTHIKNMYKI